MRTTRTSSMMMTISAPPTDPPIAEVETRKDVASGVEGSDMAAWLHICLRMVESLQLCLHAK